MILNLKITNKTSQFNGRFGKRKEIFKNCLAGQRLKFNEIYEYEFAFVSVLKLLGGWAFITQLRLG